MHAIPQPAAPSRAVEPLRAPTVAACVHTLAIRADRARAAGDQDEANDLLLEAWAAFDA
jgi:hypothetical protein